MMRVVGRCRLCGIVTAISSNRRICRDCGIIMKGIFAKYSSSHFCTIRAAYISLIRAIRERAELDGMVDDFEEFWIKLSGIDEIFKDCRHVTARVCRDDVAFLDEL